MLAKRKEFLEKEGYKQKLTAQTMALLTREQVERARETFSQAEGCSTQAEASHEERIQVDCAQVHLRLGLLREAPEGRLYCL